MDWNKKMTKEKIKSFWTDRAKITNVPRTESQVNFETDSKIADLRIKAEYELLDKKLKLKTNDVVVDLGAGNGRFTLFFAPKVHEVIAVEYIKDFTDFILKEKEKSNLKNINVLNIPAEEFCKENFADIVFVSGLLHYMDSEQYNKTIFNIYKTLKQGGILFLRETISILDEEFVVDKFSDELNAYYCSLYRTSQQHIDNFCKTGLKLEEYSPFFEDGNILNKRLETRLYYFIFHKDI